MIFDYVGSVWSTDDWRKWWPKNIFRLTYDKVNVPGYSFVIHIAFLGFSFAITN